MTANNQYLIEVCLGPECREYGGPELLAGLKQLGMDAGRGHCRGLCAFAPIVHIDAQCIAEADITQVRAALARQGRHNTSFCTASLTVSHITAKHK